MSATADHAEERTSPAVRLGFQPEQVVQEIGYDDDVDQEVEKATDVLAAQVAAALGFLHEESQLLEGETGGIGVNRRDRAGMA